MKAADFAYECPSTLTDALALLSDAAIDTRPLAGGQSLMPMMNFRLAQPQRLLDLNRIPELSFIRENGDAVEIGAMTRFVELEKSPIIAEHLPLFRTVLPHVAHPAIRNRGTIGGSIALADPAAEMPALALALDARIFVESRTASREITSQDFFLGPYETALADGELISKISIAKKSEDQKFAFYEIARRHGDYAMAGVIVALQGGQTITAARVAFFGVSDRPVRATASETALIGQTTADDAAVAAAIERVGELTFFGDLHAAADTKQHYAQVVLKRALAELNG
ncbi:MAG: xanthine dehydrogenase family protein subunit M [Hyphomicrobiaceae bacterium]